MIELLSTLSLASLTSTAALLLVLVLRKPMQCYFRPRAAYALWASVPLAILVVLIPSPTQSIPSPRPVTTVLSESLPVIAVAQPKLLAVTAIDVTPWVCMLWLLGVGVACLWFLVQQRHFMRGLGRLSPVCGNIVRAQTAVGCPALIGAWRTRIVLPIDFEQRYTLDEQRLILAHERHHRSSGDAQINALCMMLRCLFWFNPLMHFAATYFRLDQELACDAAVIASFKGRRRTYANALLKTQLMEAILPMGCYWSSDNAIAQRILLLQEPFAGRWRVAIGSSIALILVASGTYAAWAAQPPKLIQAAVDVAERPPPEIAGQRKMTPTSAAQRAADRGLISKSPRGQTTFSHTSTKPGAGLRPGEFATANDAPNPQERSVELLKSAGSNLPANIPTTASMDAPAVESAENISSGRQLPNGDRVAEEVPTYRETYPPSYPPEAIRERVQGNVLLKVNVDEAGTPRSAEIASLTPPAATSLANSSIAAVMNWRFTPALHEGKPASGVAMVPFSFRISGASAATSTDGESRLGKELDTRRPSYRLMSAIDYPTNEAAAGLQGTVQLKVLLAPDGSVTSLSIDRVEPASARVLAEVAAVSVRAWTFNPARAAGKNVASTITVPIVFALQSEMRTASLGVRRANGLDPVLVLPKG